MAALMAPSTTRARPDMHAKPPTHRSRIRQLILVLILDPLLDDLPTALAPRNQRRVELLINSSARLSMPMPAVLLARPTTRPPLRLLGLPARERRRLTLPARRASSN